MAEIGWTDEAQRWLQDIYEYIAADNPGRGGSDCSRHLSSNRRSTMSSEVAEVTRVVNAFAETWNRHDMNAFAELFAEDAEFVNVVGIWWKGRSEIKGAHEFTHQTMFKNSRLSIREVATRFPTPGIAIARCRWTLEGHVSPEGEALPARNGVLVNTLQKIRGAWRIIDSQNTDVVEGVLSRPQ